MMKVLLSSNRNPNFISFAEYIEKAFQENGCQVLFFENRAFKVPGRARDKFKALHTWDLRRLNDSLLKIAEDFKPDLFLEAGGWNILPDTINTLKNRGVATAVWTIDPPRIFDSIYKTAEYYDFVFTQGTEAFEILEKLNLKNLNWLPFGCDPDFHHPVTLSANDKKKYGCDISFVGSGWSEFYTKRQELLEKLVDFNLGIWGPGWENISPESPLRKFVRGGSVPPAEWIKIYSAAKIVFCSHYHDPSGNVPCYQVSPRVFEAMACGAFVLVDNQRDLGLLLKDGKHLAVYKDVNDLRDKAAYYLQHEEERKRIAENGRVEVLEKHTFRHRVKQLLEITSTR